MRTIWKFRLKSDCRVEMPVGAHVLCVQLQSGEPHLWAEVDSEAPKEWRAFVVAGTGHLLKPVGRYIGTFQFPAGSLVFHVYEAAQ